MITISLCMIVKNEAEVLARCLDSIQHIVDEIIIVDTGSTDETVEVAKKYTDKLYFFEWVHDFSKARNYAFSKATCDYMMWLDADDYLKEVDQEKLQKLKKEFNPEIDVAMLKYNVSFDESGNVTTMNHRERILKRSKQFQWMEPVHECITPSGHIETFDIAITHGNKNRTHSNRNLEIYEKQTSLTPRGTFYFARELKEHGRYEEAIDRYETFLKEGLGWREDNIRACFDLSDCYLNLEEKNKERAVNYLFQSFLYDLPRAEAYCRIGDYFFQEEAYHQATYWYGLALYPNAHFKGGFFNQDYCDYLPNLQLCLTFYRMGNYDLSYKHHLKTKALKPENPSVKYNEAFFKDFFANKKEDDVTNSM